MLKNSSRIHPNGSYHCPFFAVLKEGKKNGLHCCQALGVESVCAGKLGFLFGVMRTKAG